MKTGRLFLPGLVYAGILALSSVPADSFEDLVLPPGLSYVAHTVEYAVLGASLRWALDGTRRPLLTTLLVGAALAVGDETWQSTVPGREPSALDLLVDVAAVGVAARATRAVLERRSTSA